MTDFEIREARAEARTVAEAKAKIAQELGLAEEQIKFFVLDEGRVGFFGLLSRPAVVLGQAIVKVETVRKATARPVAQTAVSELPRGTSEGTEEEAESEAEAPWPEGWTEEARRFLGGFLQVLGQESEVRIGQRQDHVVLVAEGDFDWFCQGRADALDSLEFLCQLAVARRVGRRGQRPKLAVDLGHYRERRQEELEALARRTAERVRRTGKPVRLEAMPASERRIIHMVLQNEPGVATRSEGADPHRYVVVFPGRGQGRRGGSPAVRAPGGGADS